MLRREEVYRKLRSEILACKLLPGAPLFEGHLAERFDVSKSPIRDALSRLHAERLVDVMPRKGYQVAPVSLSDAADLFEMRGYLEQSCARVAAERASDADLQALDALRGYVPPGDMPSYIEYNRNFHQRMAGLCPNRRMAEATQGLIEQFDRLVLMSIVSYEDGKLSDLVAEHDAVIEALQKRDGRLASKCMGLHIQRGRKRVLSALAYVAIVP